MALNLKKGESVNLKKDAPNLNRVLVGLGWDPVRKIFGSKMDIDASIICIDESNKKSGLVYYGDKTHSSGAIRHHGDNLTGAGSGDDELIEINLDKLPNSIQRMAIIINIYSANSRGQDFSKVKNCFVHVDDLDTQKELVRYNVDGNFDGKTGIFVADIYRYKGEWKFKALGEGVKVSNISDMINMKCN